MIISEQELDYLEGCTTKVLINNIPKLYNECKYPIVSAVIMHTDTKKAYNQNETFLIDTGSPITILRSEFKIFLKQQLPVNKTIIQYGKCNPTKLDVYKITLLIKSFEINTFAAFDPNFPYHTFSVIGNTFGLRDIDIFVSNYKKNISQLIKYF